MDEQWSEFDQNREDREKVLKERGRGGGGGGRKKEGREEGGRERESGRGRGGGGEGEGEGEREKELEGERERERERGVKHTQQTSVTTENFVIDDSSDGQAVEAVCEDLPYFYAIPSLAWREDNGEV